MFKTLLLCSYVVVLLCGCNDPRFKVVSDDGNRKDMIDLQTVDKASRSVMHVIEFKKDNSKINNLAEVDCKRRAFRYVSVKMYDGAGRIAVDLSNVNKKAIPWQPVKNPDSIAAAVVDTYCSAK